MTKRNRIFTIIGVGTVLISAELLIIQLAKRFANDVASGIVNAAPAAEDLFKGTLGKALLENRRVQGIPADQKAVRPRVSGEHHETAQSLLDCQWRSGGSGTDGLSPNQNVQSPNQCHCPLVNQTGNRRLACIHVFPRGPQVPISAPLVKLTRYLLVSLVRASSDNSAPCG